MPVPQDNKKQGNVPVPDFHVLIPARLKSTRLPDKPLADIAGVPMVVRVAQQALMSGACSVTVAADDELILQACATHQIKAISTDVDHASGSDRLAQACDLLGLPDEAIVVNVQGDEPLIDPRLIAACAQQLQSHPDCAMSTAAHAIRDDKDYANPNIVKVVCNAKGQALYFSRAPIPWWRNGNLANPSGIPHMPGLSESQTQCMFLHHIGIYGYRVAFLKRFPNLPVSPLEQLESLEQLRVLWHGEHIAVYVTEAHPGAGVDTAADLERVRQFFAQKL